MAMLKKAFFCLKCHVEKDRKSQLMTCTRCSLAWYCSRNCQKDDFDDHKSFCKDIKKQKEKVERFAQVMRSAKLGFDNREENMFETQVGRFWGHFTAEDPQPRDYMRARYILEHFFRGGGVNFVCPIFQKKITQK
jgi:hypothetical protein